MQTIQGRHHVRLPELQDWRAIGQRIPTSTAIAEGSVEKRDAPSVVAASLLAHLLVRGGVRERVQLRRVRDLDLQRSRSLRWDVASSVFRAAGLAAYRGLIDTVSESSKGQYGCPAKVSADVQMHLHKPGVERRAVHLRGGERCQDSFQHGDRKQQITACHAGCLRTVCSKSSASKAAKI